MKVVFFAAVTFDQYNAGDLIPGAGWWPHVTAYITQGKIAPALVASLPEDIQDALAEWEVENGKVEDDGPTLSVPVTPAAAAAGADGDDVGEDDTGADESGDASGSAEADPDDSYEDWTVAELKGELDARGVPYKSSDNKPDLIALLEADDEGDTTGE